MKGKREPEPFKPMKSSICCIFIALLLGAGVPRSMADITANGNWTLVADASQLVSGAGSDLKPQYESATGTTTINVTNIPAGNSWRVVVHLADNTWNPALKLYIRRTSDGNGSGTITGGGAYVEVTGADTEIFCGTSTRCGIAIQTQLTGVSRNIMPNTYNTGLVFTIIP